MTEACEFALVLAVMMLANFGVQRIYATSSADAFGRRVAYYLMVAAVVAVALSLLVLLGNTFGMFHRA